MKKNKEWNWLLLVILKKNTSVFKWLAAEMMEKSKEYSSYKYEQLYRLWNELKKAKEWIKGLLCFCGFFFRVSYKRLFFFYISCSKITSAQVLLILISLQNKWTNFSVFIYFSTRRQIIDARVGSNFLQTCNLNVVHDFLQCMLYFILIKFPMH